MERLWDHLADQDQKETQDSLDCPEQKVRHKKARNIYWPSIIYLQDDLKGFEGWETSGKKKQKNLKAVEKMFPVLILRKTQILKHVGSLIQLEFALKPNAFPRPLSVHLGTRIKLRDLHGITLFIYLFLPHFTIMAKNKMKKSILWQTESQSRYLIADVIWSIFQELMKTQDCC